ncbi:hypothetical protein TNCV_2472411 [Trichonephila clavipes]|nr:hypothetical protein TNCV_2472411 [Trichonephila clavipes]
MNNREREKRLYVSQGLKRWVPSSLYSRSHKHMRNDINKLPSQEPVLLPGSSNQREARRANPPHKQSSRKTRMEADRIGETMKKESQQSETPCPYYLRSRFKDSEGLQEEQRSRGIGSLPENNFRRNSLSVEAFDGDPTDRST